MVFTVEDGTGLADANSYATVAFYRSYFADRGVDVTTETDGQIQGWLVQATDYIGTRWEGRLKGWPISQTQALHFPAEGVYLGCHLQPTSPLPTALQKATVEYARLAKSGPLYLTPTTDASGLMLAGRREKVGPLEQEFTYLGGVAYTVRKLPVPDRLMASLLTGSGGGLIRN